VCTGGENLTHTHTNHSLVTTTLEMAFCFNIRVYNQTQSGSSMECGSSSPCTDEISKAFDDCVSVNRDLR
jgi:hypothetical protein